MASFFGSRSPDRAPADGRMLGPNALGEFMRTDLAPMIAAPSSHFLPIARPAFRSALSESARFVGALFEMCWTRVPVAASFFGEPLEPFPP